MPHFGLLRLVERIFGGHEIRAGILPVVVKEQVVKIVRQVIVMGDVLLRSA